jgi:hypothetical protein
LVRTGLHHARFDPEVFVSIYGLLFGVAMGIGMGYGTYAVMPIPYSMALTWFLGTVVEATVGGLLAGLIVRS